MGTFPGFDGGRFFEPCKLLRAERGTRNPGTSLNLWYPTLARAEERRRKGVLTETKFDDATKLMKTQSDFMTAEGRSLQSEAKAQVEYGMYMAKVTNQLENKSFKLVGIGSAPGMDKLFATAHDLYHNNPKFRSSLIVGLPKGAVAKAQHGNNAELDGVVTNFYRFIHSYDRKMSSVVAANLGGPGERWL